jgi:propanol-preferring alcohol dehydrogenase
MLNIGQANNMLSSCIEWHMNSFANTNSVVNDTIGTMTAMVLNSSHAPLKLTQLPIPTPGPHDVLIKVSACGVCRTDLHIQDGELPLHQLPLIPGHEIVGTIVDAGTALHGFNPGTRIGVPWLGGSCGECRYCLHGTENLCHEAKFTGYDKNGGYAEYALADARYCTELPHGYDDEHVAPLLCAGLIGYRAYAMLSHVDTIGLYGFGAAAHIIVQIAQFQGKHVYAFTRPDDTQAQDFARSLGAVWAGRSDMKPPVELDAAIIFAPVGSLVPQALGATRRGGTVICAGIHMSDIPSFPYKLLWQERTLRSVANLTRRDAAAFFQVARQFDIKTSPVSFPLTKANEALQALRKGNINGAAVLVP